MRAPQPAFRRPRLAVASLLAAGLAVGCTPGSPVWCATALADGGCTVHVEVHCGGGPLCGPGSVPVLDAGGCVRDAAADVLGCS